MTGPYTNVLDLYLFPSMSHRHSAHLQRGTNTEPSLDRIWQVVESVWRDTVSAEVARSCIQPLPQIIQHATPLCYATYDTCITVRSFILAFRIMKLIIQEQGNNAWLAHGTPHLQVRSDYIDTETGIKRKQVIETEEF
jgi:hypothetical protein